MRRFFNYFSDHGVMGVILALAFGLIMTSGAAAGYKLMTGAAAAKDNQAEALELPDIDEAPSQPTDTLTMAGSTESVAANQTPTVNGAVPMGIPAVTPTPTKKPVLPAVTPTSKPSTLPLAVQPTQAAGTTVQATSNQCVVTLWGKQYNVTRLRSTHPGGDIFVCGTDMTAVYQQQHGTSLSRMAPYLITSGSTGLAGGPTPTPGTGNPGAYYNDDNDEEDEHEQERYLEHETETEDHESGEVETEQREADDD